MAQVKDSVIEKISPALELLKKDKPVNTKKRTGETWKSFEYSLSKDAAFLKVKEKIEHIYRVSTGEESEDTSPNGALRVSGSHGIKRTGTPPPVIKRADSAGIV